MIQEIRHIKAFLAIAKLGNFTRAATELRISQPALTVQIRHLEETLGTRLFDRSKRTVTLTEAGQSLVGPLERVLRDLQAALTSAHDLATLQQGAVSVAMLPAVAASLLPPIVQHFRSRYPRIAINIQDAVAEQIIKLVKAGDVDFGIGECPENDRDIVATDFLVDRMCAFLPQGHPLSGKRPLTLHDIVAFPLILTASGTSVRHLVTRALKKEKLDVGPAYEANYMSTAVGMVRAGLGIAILPASAVDCACCDGLAAEVIRTPGLTRNIKMIVKAGRSLSPSAEKFACAIRDEARHPLRYFSAAPARGTHEGRR